MPNSDWDPSVHTGLPVETVQPNNNSQDIPFSWDDNIASNNNNYNNNNSTYVEGRQYSNKISSALHLLLINVDYFGMYVSLKEIVLLPIKILKNIETQIVKYMLKLKEILRLILTN